nr:54s ribosomal protein l25, mitochondrial [Quercus suber]
MANGEDMMQFRDKSALQYQCNGRWNRQSSFVTRDAVGRTISSTKLSTSSHVIFDGHPEDLRFAAIMFDFDIGIHSTTITTPRRAGMATNYMSLARELPKPLLHFFKRFPPPQINGRQPSALDTISPTIPSDHLGESTPLEPLDPSNVSASAPLAPQGLRAPETSTWKTNPFLPFRNPSTGVWHGPHYSLRRQAELFRLATEHHVLSLMPPSVKHPEIKEQKRILNGLRVKGTGVGQKVKGKYWERTLRSRLEQRRKAMEMMPDMIQLWKERGHGRGWKKWPKGKHGTGEHALFSRKWLCRAGWVSDHQYILRHPMADKYEHILPEAIDCDTGQRCSDQFVHIVQSGGGLVFG